MINENTEGADVEALIVGDERSIKYKRVIYSSPKVQANLRKLIPFYDNMGIFDWINTSLPNLDSLDYQSKSLNTSTKIRNLRNAFKMVDKFN